MNAKPNYDTGYLKVCPRSAGDFGFASFSGSHHKGDMHLKEFKSEIERHLGGYLGRSGGVDIEYELFICSECGNEYETKKEAEECCNPTSNKEITREEQE